MKVIHITADQERAQKKTTRRKRRKQRKKTHTKKGEWEKTLTSKPASHTRRALDSAQRSAEVVS